MMKLSRKKVFGLCILLTLACDAPVFLTRATPTVLFAIGDAAPTVTSNASGTTTRTSAQFIAPTGTPAPPEIERAMYLEEIAQIQVNAPVRLIWSLDEQSLGVVTQSGVSLFNAQTWQLRKTIAVNDPARLLDVSADMRLYITTVADARVLELRDMNTSNVLRTIRLDSPALGVNFSPDGKWVVVAHTEGIAASVWDAQTAQLSRKYTGFETAAPVYGARIASDNKTLLWISRATIQLMDLASGRFGARFSHEDFVMDEQLTRDAKTLVTAAEGTIIFWDAASGKKSKMNLDSNPLMISISPGDRVLAFGSAKNVLLWDVTARKQLRALTGHAASITAVAFAREAFRLASASEDGAVKVWGVVK